MSNLNQLAIIKQKKKLHRRKLLFVWGLLFLPLLQFVLFYLAANVYSFVLSFYYEPTGIFTTQFYQQFFTDFFNLNHRVGGGEYLRALKYSFLLGLNDVILVFVSLILSYFIYKKIPGRKIFRVVFFLPSIISMIVYVGVFKMLLDNSTGIPYLFGIELKFLNEGSLAQKFLVPIYCLWVGTGYNILVLGGAMANVPNEVIENAKLEGVSRFRELFQIIIPMIWPTLVVSFIGSITVVFTLFIQVKLLTGGAEGTETIAYIINSNVDDHVNKAAVAGIMFSLISIPAVLLFKKLLEKIGKKWGY